MLINDFFTYILSMHWILASKPFDTILILIMFSIGLSHNFKSAPSNSRPIKSIITTLLLVYIINPLATLLFTIGLDLNQTTSFCLLLISSCLGGRYQPIFAFLGQGNVKLSLIMHVIINGLSIFTTPLILSTLIYLHPKFESFTYLNLSNYIPACIFLITSFVLPYLTGLLFSKYFPLLTDTLYKPIRNINLWVMLIMMLLSIGLNLSSYYNLIAMNLAYLVAYSMLLFLISYIVGKIANLNTPEQRSIILNGSMGNYGLLYFLIINFFPGETFYVAFVGTWGHIFLLQTMIAVLFWNISGKKRNQQQALSI